MTATEPTASGPGLGARDRLPLALVCGTLFVAPLKFGSVIGGGESADFPVGLAQWIFATWPPFLASACCGVALLVVTGISRSGRVRRLHLLVPGAWAVLLVTACLGLVRTTEWDYAQLFLCSLCGAVALAWAGLRLLDWRPRAKVWILWTVAAATILCCLSGWSQRFGGLEETRKQALAQAERAGVELPPALLGRLEQGRAFGPFVYPNSYAAHLILTGPLLLLLIWRAAGRVRPPTVTRAIFVGGGAVLWIGALWFSGSRGAFLACAGGAVISVLSLRRFRAWRWPLLGIGVLSALLLLALASRDRNLLSVSSRMDYYVAALRMFAARPVFGVGLGEFFHEYLRLKPVLAEETRAAHSMILGMFSQAGTLAGLASALCVGLPVLLLFLPTRLRTSDEPLFACVVGGVAAWGCHALVDFNLQITGTVVTAALLPVFCLPEAKGAAPALPRGWRAAGAAFGVLAFLSAAWRIPGEQAFQRLVNDADVLPVASVRERCTEVAARLPLSPYPWALLGRRAEQMRGWETARDAYGQALLRSPHRASFRARMAENSLLMGEWDRGLAAAEETVMRYPGSARYQLLAAVAALAADPERAQRLDVPMVVRSSLSLHARWQEGVPVPAVLLGAPPQRPLSGVPRADICLLLNAAPGRRHPLGGSLRFEAEPVRQPAAVRP